MSSLSAFSAFQALSNSRRNVAEPVYRYVAPTAMGAANGLTPEDAIALADINALIAANRRAVIRLRADQGDYSRNAVLPLSAGGVKIRGWHPTDPTARAVLLSDRPSPFIPKGGQYNGQSFFRLNSGADDIRFGNIDPSNIGNGFVILGADISGLILEDMDAVNLNRFLDTNNGALSNAIIRRCTGFGYEKGFIRLQGNSHDVLIEDIGGDSDENDDEPFCIGIALGGTAHDITIRRVSSINIVSNVGPTTYWNGDGFTQENGNYNIFYDTCYAAYCSDGGFDLKNISRLLNCNAVGCKRNYRFWTGHFIATNCRSENPISKGGDRRHRTLQHPRSGNDRGYLQSDCHRDARQLISANPCGSATVDGAAKIGEHELAHGKIGVCDLCDRVQTDSSFFIPLRKVAAAAISGDLNINLSVCVHVVDQVVSRLVRHVCGQARFAIRPGMVD
jgi:hypothetical protein